MQNNSGKIQVLSWSDAPNVSTGFGIVSRYILTALHNTGKYEIDQLGINWHGDFIDKSVFPWNISPAKALDHRDPYGNQMFYRAVASGKYDLVWIMNDTFVVHEIAEHLRKLFDQMKAENKKIPKIIYYYPVDCQINERSFGMLKLADVLVCYTEHGKTETLNKLPEVADKLQKIHHGTDTRLFKPYSRDLSLQLRKKWFNLEEDTYVIINVNRNSLRKQLTRTLLCFKEFRKSVPNTKLYLHTMPIDRGSGPEIDLNVAMDQLGLKFNEDVLLPPNYSPSRGYPTEALNELYNASDMYLTTHCGEGWGLSVTEAMAAGVPVVAPDNTSMPEILGNGERGNLYPCNEWVFLENSGYRKMGLIEDTVNEMYRVYRLGWKHNSKKVVAARKWVEENNWGIICQQWLDLFEKVSETLSLPSKEDTTGEIL